MSESPVLVDLTDDVLTITLNRPERLNALNPDLLTAFDQAFEHITPTTTAVVIRGNGRSFCAGHDLTWGAENAATNPTEADIAASTDRLHEITRRIRATDIPVIAQVHGHAIGGGAEIALSADFIIAADTTTFRFTETAVGLVVTNGFTAVLPRTAGPVIAKEIIMLGEPFTAEQAHTWQLINRVVPETDLTTTTTAFITTLAQKSPNALTLAKNLIDNGWDHTFTDVMNHETQATIHATQHPDSTEAANAFTQKRPPNFRRG